MKRVVDVLVSVLLMLLLSPLYLVVSALILIVLGRPVFFTQPRPGLRGRPFKLIKFRTMRNVLNKEGATLTDEHRMTKLGSFLRSYSIDELPELWNVFKGEMSLVGPRPLLVEYLPLYTADQARRHDVLPGVTGWAQVNGRNELTWEKKFEFDLWYVENRSFTLDLKILLLTVVNTIRRKGISHKGTATMPTFQGYEKQ